MGVTPDQTAVPELTLESIFSFEHVPGEVTIHDDPAYSMRASCLIYPGREPILGSYTVLDLQVMGMTNFYSIGMTRDSDAVTIRVYPPEMGSVPISKLTVVYGTRPALLARLREIAADCATYYAQWRTK